MPKNFKTRKQIFIFYIIRNVIWLWKAYRQRIQKSICKRRQNEMLYGWSELTMAQKKATWCSAEKRHDTEMQHHENNKLIDQDLKSTLSQTLYFLKQLQKATSSAIVALELSLTSSPFIAFSFTPLSGFSIKPLSQVQGSVTLKCSFSFPNMVWMQKKNLKKGWRSWKYIMQWWQLSMTIVTKELYETLHQVPRGLEEQAFNLGKFRIKHLA